MSDRHTIWTNRIIELVDKGLSLLEQRKIKLNGKSVTDLRRKISERRPKEAAPIAKGENSRERS